MAEMLLDALYDVASVALRLNHMHNKIIILKEHANFRLIVKLKNWTNINLGNVGESDEDAYDHHLSDDQADSGVLTCHVTAGSVVKEEDIHDTGSSVSNVGLH